MSGAKIDVLAVMDRAEDSQLREFMVESADEIRQARDAVAELIEAARDYADVEANAYDITQRIPAATRLRAAIARVKGVQS